MKYEGGTYHETRGKKMNRRVSKKLAKLVKKQDYLKQIIYLHECSERNGRVRTDWRITLRDLKRFWLKTPHNLRHLLFKGGV